MEMGMEFYRIKKIIMKNSEKKSYNPTLIIYQEDKEAMAQIKIKTKTRNISYSRLNNNNS